jgi:hypothetical protein
VSTIDDVAWSTVYGGRPIPNRPDDDYYREPADEGIIDPESRFARLRSRVFTLTELANLPPVEYLIPGVLPHRGLGFLYGPSGHGKSFVALDMGLSIASGIAYAGRPTRRANVLYLVAEGASGLKKRTDAWAVHNPHGDPGDRFKVLPEAINLADPNGVDTGYIAAIAEENKSEVVIVDTMARAMTGFDENSARDIGVFIGNSELLARAIDGLVLPVHHTGKDVTRGMRGNSAAFGGAEVVIECMRDANEVTLKNPKMKDDEEFSPLRFTMVKKGVSIALEYQDGLYVPPAKSEVIEELLRVIHRLDDGTGVPGGVVQEGYQSTTGRGRSDFYDTKRQAIERGLVRNLGSPKMPRFALTSSGFDLLGLDSP